MSIKIKEAMKVTAKNFLDLKFSLFTEKENVVLQNVIMSFAEQYNHEFPALNIETVILTGTLTFLFYLFLVNLVKQFMYMRDLYGANLYLIM